MKHFVLFYESVDNYAEKRAPFRKTHLAHAQAAQARGELVLAGAYADPVDGALLIFNGETASVAEDFARTDPYVLNGLITRWKVREWTTVVGDGASVKVVFGD